MRAIRPARAATPGPLNAADWHIALVWLAIALGAAARLYGLGRVPGGLNSDEASTGVEALSILQTGMDRWGNRLPVWFPAWGSGMNALYSYIAVPVVALFGLDATVLRAIDAAFGVATLPIAYMAARLHLGRNAALITLWLLALLPWHVMASRWALDSNLAPFWFTLGLYTIGRALRDGRRWPIVAFLPWAIAIYAYPTTILGSLPAAILIVAAFRQDVREDYPRWAAGVALAAIVALPFLLFMVKTEFAIDRLPFESLLPFSIPALAATRLSQISQPIANTLFANLSFIVGGYRDGVVWHQSIYFLPLGGAAPLLTLLGGFVLARDWVKARRLHPVLIVALCAIVPTVLLPLNLTRLNWFYIPSLMLIGHLLAQCRLQMVSGQAGRVMGMAVALYFALFIGLFYPYYFIYYNDELKRADVNLGNGFRVGLEGALRAEIQAAGPDEPVLIAVGTVHPYLYLLFYGLADIRDFQATRRMEIENGVYRVSSFGRFAFETAALPPGRSFVFVSRNDRLPCASPMILRTDPLWTVGRCPG